MNIVFIGSKELGIICLRELLNKNFRVSNIFTLDDRADSRSCYRDFITIAKQNKINLGINPKEDDLIKIIKSKNIDIILVCNWYKIISKDLIKLPKIGIFGIHNSLLPKYRGMSPLIWSALSNDNFLGSTFFKFDEGMDTGDIVKQWKIINDDLYIEEILKKLSSKIAKDLPQIFSNLMNNKTIYKKQNHKNSTYCNKRIPKDSKLEWSSLNSKDLLKRIKIFNHPYPLNFSLLGRKKIHILKARLFKKKVDGIPGSLLHINNKVVVCCFDKKGIEIEKAIDSKGKSIPLNRLKGRFSY